MARLLTASAPRDAGSATTLGHAEFAQKPPYGQVIPPAAMATSLTAFPLVTVATFVVASIVLHARGAPASSC
jgi:hypothetical protein